MAITREAITEGIEQFIRTEYLVSGTDPAFTREVHLFEFGFVDSVGFVELLEFIRARYGVELAGEQVFDEKVSSINGLSEVVWSSLRP
jgi:methoxymalonate biosynthesis acyl carrier protein